MRIRNIKNAFEIVEKDPIIIKELNNKTFKNNNKIHLEIGMGKGDFIINMAQKYPNINFIGIERYPSIILRAIQKLDSDPLNLRFICDDADNINDFIKVKISTLYLNFSDPWPKKRHIKRRLTHKRYLDKYERLFNSEINIYLKTDNKDFFAYSIQSLSNNGYKFKAASLDLHKENITNIETEYENKFLSRGIPINYLHAFKKILKWCFICYTKYRSNYEKDSSINYDNRVG